MPKDNQINFLKENREAKKAPLKRFGRYSVTIISASLLVSLVAVAGSLTPPGVPAGTMRTLQEIYDTVAGTFDSSAISSDPDGSVIQGLKYITENLFWASGSFNSIYNTNTGSVGIGGTTNPASPLEVVVSGSGGSGGDGILISGDVGLSPAVLFGASPGGTLMGQVGTVMSAGDFVLGSALDDMVMENTQTGNLLFGINDQEMMRIASTGNIGIGTTAPEKLFHVDGDVKFGGTGYGSLFPGFGRLFLRTDDGAGFQPFLLFQDLTYGPSGMGFSFITDGTTAGTRMDTIDSAGSPIYTLTESGNVGIGTTAPFADFVLNRTDSVDAVIQSTTTASEAFAALDLLTEDGAHGLNIWANNSLRSIGAGPLSVNISNSDDAPIAFFTNGSERLRIMGNGNVGIGTTAPVAQLETRGTTGLITYSGAPYASFTADSQSYIDYGSNVFTSLNDSAVRASGLMGGIQDDTMTRNIIGTYGWAESTNSVLSTKSVVALNGDAYNSGSGGVTSVRGLVTYAAQFGSGPVGELTGIYLGSHDVGAGTGTVTNNFGLYIGNQTNLATNNYALYSEVGPVVVTASGSVGIGTANPTTQLDVIGNAFVSGDFEVDGVLYADGGCVGCGGTGGSSVGLREGFTGSFTNFSSISFNGAHFALDTGNPDARLSLDWGAGGPASLSQNETVTGTWSFSTNPTFSGGGRLVTSNSLDFDEFENAMDLDANTTITGGAFALTFDHASVSSNFEVRGYASASQTFGSGLTDCDLESQTLNWDSATGRFSCLADASSGSGVASDSLDFDEFEDAMDLDANTTISNGGFRLTIQGASMSGNFDPTINDTFDLGEDLLRWRDIYLGPGSMHIGTSLADEYVVSYDTTSNYIGFNANGSGDPEVLFNSAGNVGIGTTTAGARLTVSGGATIGTTTAGNAISLNTSAGTNTTDIGTGTTTGSVTLGANLNDIVIDSADWDVTAAGAISTTGLLSTTGGLTTSVNTVNLNAGGNVVNLATSTASTGGVLLGNGDVGGTNTVTVNSSTWDVTAAGAFSGITTLTMSGLLTLPGGLTTLTSPVNLNAGGNTVNIATTTASTGGVLLGNGGVGGTNTITIDTANFDVTAGGALTATSLSTPSLLTLTGGLTTSVGVLNLNAGGNVVNLATTTASTGGVLLGNGDVGGTNTVTVNSNTWDITAAGAISGVTTFSSSGLMTLTGGLTTNTGAVNINSGGNALNIGTGTQSGAITVGNGGETIAVNSSDWDISTTGLFTGVSGVDSTGAEALNLNNTATGDIVMAGGVGATGCTLTNATGAFSCAGNITTTATGTPTAGFWTRDTASGYLYPSTIGDNVGIGTSSPAQKLDIGGSAANMTFSNATGPHQIITGGTSVLALMPGGNVGIGTTTATEKLRVEGNIYASLQATAANHAVLGSRTISAGTGMTGGGALTGDLTLSSTTWSASGGGNIFNLNANNVGIGEDTPTSKLQVNGNTALGYAGAVTAPANGLTVSGNVGIGTTVATEKLEVLGNVLVTGNITATGTVGGASLSGTCNLAANVDVPQDATPNVTVDFTDSNCADYAEVYPSSEAVHPGDLLVLDTAHPGKVKKASQGNSANIMGIVSTSPAAIVGYGKFISGKIASEYDNPSHPAVALIGRVPVKASLENGPIAVGDHLAASSIPGVVTKANEAGISVGIALQPLNSVASGSYQKIMSFVNVGYWAPDVESLVSDTSLGIQISPTSILSYVLDYLGDAILEVKKLVAGTVKTKNFEIEDSATGEIYCVRIVNGEWDKQEGECSSAPAQNSSPSETPAEDPDTDTDPTAQGGEPLTESPSDSGAEESSSDESTSEEAPAPEPEQNSESETESSSTTE